MKQDQAIIYNALYHEVKIAIINIKNIGFDMDDFEKALKQINDNVCNNVKNNYVSGMAEASYISFYTSGIKELNLLKTRLDMFDIYVKADNICNYINMKLDDNLDSIELSSLVSEMIYVLDGINKSATMDYDKEEDIIKKIYEVAYNIIKFEIVLNGESQLYLYVKEKGDNIAYFNNLVLDEIKEIDLKKEKNELIKMRLFLLGKNGIYAEYLDLELIKLLLLSDNHIDLKKKIVSRIDELAKGIVNNNEMIHATYEDYDSCLRRKDKRLSVIKKNRHDIRNKIIAILCTVACMLGIAIGIPKLAKKRASGKDAYMKRTITYSTVDDTYNEAEEKVFDKDHSDKVEVKVYLPADKASRRKYEIYDLSGNDFETLNDYYEHVINNPELIPEDTGREKSTVTNDEYAEVTSIRYEYLGKSFNEEYYTGTMWVLYFFYIYLLLIVEMCFLTTENNTMLIGMLSKLKEYIRDLKYVKCNYDEIELELRDRHDELVELINKNELLRAQFSKLYEDNKFLLDNPEELLKRINEINIGEYVEKAKKLTKDRK